MHPNKVCEFIFSFVHRNSHSLSRSILKQSIKSKNIILLGYRMLLDKDCKELSGNILADI